jgi:hypothetical protein
LATVSVTPKKHSNTNLGTFPYIQVFVNHNKTRRAKSRSPAQNGKSSKTACMKAILLTANEQAMEKYHTVKY